MAIRDGQTPTYLLTKLHSEHLTVPPAFPFLFKNHKKP